MSHRGRFFGLISPPASLKDSSCFQVDTCEAFFAHLPQLETERLCLRALTMRDARDMFAYSKDPDVAQYVLWDAHENIGQTRAYLRFILRQYRNGEPTSYGIILKETNKVIGTIGFMWLNQESRSAEIGYSLARENWNQGLMTEALKALIDFSFDRLHLNRLEAQHDTRNLASGKVMLHCGMKKEGTLRQRIYNKGRYIDVDIYAIVATDRRASLR